MNKTKQTSYIPTGNKIIHANFSDGPMRHKIKWAFFK